MRYHLSLKIQAKKSCFLKYQINCNDRQQHQLQVYSLVQTSLISCAEISSRFKHMSGTTSEFIGCGRVGGDKDRVGGRQTCRAV